MRTEGKLSKVAICPKCNGYVSACHIDFLANPEEEIFTQLTNEGFEVKLETIARTQARKLSMYNDCKKHVEAINH